MILGSNCELEDDESFYLSSNGSASEEDDDEDNNAQEAGDNGNNDLKRKINQLTVRMNKFQEKKDHYKEEFKNAQTRVRNLKRENKCLRKQLEDKRISAPPTVSSNIFKPSIISCVHVLTTNYSPGKKGFRHICVVNLLPRMREYTEIAASRRT